LWAQSVISIPHNFNPAFTQAVGIPGGQDVIVIGGQNGVDSSGQVVSDDLAGQTRQALSNLMAASGRRTPTLITFGLPEAGTAGPGRPGS
jgi:hypothetical protein